ncbi:FCD domain-containing protein, partial [Escherichia coli]|uniref:FCD domain-containing protein n=1 Tax=Escherichia coli TaxID=562 RepID=UPI001FCEA993
ADRNRSHWSTSKTPSYTKSVSWQHHPNMPILCEMIEQLWVRMGPGLHYLYEAINPAELREHIENYHLLLAALKAKDKEGCRHCLAEIMQQNIAILYQQYNR